MGLLSRSILHFHFCSTHERSFGFRVFLGHQAQVGHPRLSGKIRHEKVPGIFPEWCGVVLAVWYFFPMTSSIQLCCKKGPIAKYFLSSSINSLTFGKIFRFGGRKRQIDNNPQQRKAPPPLAKSENRAILWAQNELAALLLAFGSTIGAYLLAKDDGITPSEFRERALWFLVGIFSFFRRYIHIYPKLG